MSGGGIPGHMLAAITPPIIEPWVERTVLNGLTYGCGPAGYDIRIAEDVILDKGDFVLASSIERFNMPNDVKGTVHDKSTWVRKGLTVQNTVIEPGWRGYLTLELINHSTFRVKIKRGDPIAQVMFDRLLEPVRNPYDGKYQNAPAGPQPPILEGEK